MQRGKDFLNKIITCITTEASTRRIYRLFTASFLEETYCFEFRKELSDVEHYSEKFKKENKHITDIEVEAKILIEKDSVLRS